MAAGIAIAIGLLRPEWHGLSGDPGERVVFWGAAFLATGITGAVGLLLPLVIADCPRRSFQNPLAAALCAGRRRHAGARLLRQPASASRYEESIDHPPPPISREAEIAAAAGAVFGLTYWLIAGRNAGRWRER